MPEQVDDERKFAYFRRLRKEYHHTIPRATPEHYARPSSYQSWLEERMREQTRRIEELQGQVSTREDVIASRHEMLADLNRKLTDAQEREKRLRSFFHEGMSAAFNGCGWDGPEIQDRAEELGLAYWDKYDPEKHASLGSFEGEEGDNILIIEPEFRARKGDE